MIRKRPYFDLHQAYYILDPSNKGFINEDDITKFLKSRGVIANPTDI